RFCLVLDRRRGAIAKAERSEQRLEPTSNCRIRDAKLALHLFQVSPGAKEALQDGELPALKPSEATNTELALERRPAATALQTGDRQLALADRAGGDDVAGHQRVPKTRAGRRGGIRKKRFPDRSRAVSSRCCRRRSSKTIWVQRTWPSNIVNSPFHVPVCEWMGRILGSGGSLVKYILNNMDLELPITHIAIPNAGAGPSVPRSAAGSIGLR